MADTQTRPEKVASKHPRADRAIKSMREVASWLKTVGDENVELHGQLKVMGERIEELERANEKLAAESVDLKYNGARLEHLRETVFDYDRGTIDRGELVRRARED